MANYKLSVDVTPHYLPDQSSPDENLYAFAYTVVIHNTGDIATQVISRTWHINDAQGMHEKVKGLGVVGHQPLLRPGESFQYSSASRLRTATGTMHGQYFCVAEDGTRFEAEIPMFVLEATPGSPARVLH